MNSIFKTLLSLTLCLSLLAGCASTSSSPSAPAPSTVSSQEENSIETFVIGTTMKITSLSRECYDYNVLSGAFTHMSLTKLTENGEAVPFMAKEIKSDDGLIWNITLRNDLKWEDGTPVTAKDVAFTLNYKKLGKEINIIDDYSLEIVLATPNSRLPVDLVPLRIMPLHIFSSNEGVETMNDITAAMGCGPYKLSQFHKASGVLEFTANEAYPDGPPNAKNVIVKLFSNTDTLYMALLKGEIDMIYFYSSGVDPAAVNLFKSNPKITLHPLADNGVTLIYFNTEAEPVNDVNLRKAISYALDYEKLKELFASEYAVTPSYGIVPKGLGGFVPTTPLKRDLAKAKEYLAEYGQESITVEFVIRSDKPAYARMGELITANLAEVGITAVIKPVDTAQFRTITETEHTHTAMISRATPWGMQMKAGLGVGYMSAKASGLANVNDENFFKIADKMLTATPEEYLVLCKQMQEYYEANVPAIPLFWDSFIHAYSSKYEGFTVDGTFGLLSFDTWKQLKQTKKA